MRNGVQTSQSLELEQRLEAAIEAITKSIVRPYAIRRHIQTMRGLRKEIQPVPEDVKRWFEETEDSDDE